MLWVMLALTVVSFASVYWWSGLWIGNVNVRPPTLTKGHFEVHVHVIL